RLECLLPLLTWNDAVFFEKRSRLTGRQQQNETDYNTSDPHALTGRLTDRFAVFVFCSGTSSVAPCGTTPRISSSLSFLIFRVCRSFWLISCIGFILCLVGPNLLVSWAGLTLSSSPFAPNSLWF